MLFLINMACDRVCVCTRDSNVQKLSFYNAKCRFYHTFLLMTWWPISLLMTNLDAIFLHFFHPTIFKTFISWMILKIKKHRIFFLVNKSFHFKIELKYIKKHHNHPQRQKEVSFRDNFSNKNLIKCQFQRIFRPSVRIVP